MRTQPFMWMTCKVKGVQLRIRVMQTVARKEVLEKFLRKQNKIMQNNLREL